MKQTSLFGHFTRSTAEHLSSHLRSPESPKRRRPSTPQYEDMSPPKARRRGKRRVAPPVELDGSEAGGSDSDLNEVRLQPEEDEVEVVEDSPKRPSPKRRRLQRNRAASSDDGTVPTDGDDDQEGEILAIRTQRNSKVWRKQSLVLDSDDEREEPKRSKLVKQRPQTPEEEIEDEVDKNLIVDTRLRNRGKQSNHRSKYLENLERLKRKKKGDSSPSAIPSDEEDDDAQEVIEVDTPIPGARPSTASDDDEDSEEEDEDNFIIEDDGNEASFELPVAFSMDTHQDLSHHFKIICQLFVHLAVADDREIFMAEAMRNQYFSVPLQATRKKLLGMRDSLVASSMWHADFKQPLEQYPNLDVVRLDFTVPGCDACRMASRTSTLCAHLSGQRYYPDTYETRPESNHSDEEEGEDDEDDESEDGDDKPKQTFNLGRFCARRTRVYHEFCHWEYKLFHVLDEEISTLRNSHEKGFVRVAYAGGRQPPKDLKKADDIVDWLDQRTIVDFQYKVLKDMVESAHHLEVAYKRGDDDGEE